MDRPVRDPQKEQAIEAAMEGFLFLSTLCWVGGATETSFSTSALVTRTELEYLAVGLETSPGCFRVGNEVTSVG